MPNDNKKPSNITLSPDQVKKLRHAIAEFQKRVNYLEEKFKLKLIARPIAELSEDKLTIYTKAKISIIPYPNFFSKIQVPGLIIAKKMIPEQDL